MENTLINLRSNTASELKQRFQETDHEFLVLANKKSAPVLEEGRLSGEMLKSEPNLQLILHFAANSDQALSAWETLPSRLAALRENPTPHLGALVLKTSAAREAGFLDVSEPVWDFIIRISKSPGSIQTRPSKEELDSQEHVDRPGLAPHPPGTSQNWLKSHLLSVSPEELVSKLASPPDGIALKAGLLQIHNDLDASHELSQSIEGEGRHRSGDYWHAIMHRREPDYSNARYWFRRVGTHPVFEQLRDAVDSLLSETENPAAETARQKLGGKWDPLAFVDFCQECERKQDPDLTRIAQEIQWREMRLLLEQTYQDATG